MSYCEDKENYSSDPVPPRDVFHEELITSMEGVWELYLALEDQLPLLQFPTIVVVGDENSGKSTLLERFVGKRLLPTSKHSTTRSPVIIRLVHDAGMSAQEPVTIAVAVGENAAVEQMETDRVLGMVEDHFEGIAASSPTGYSDQPFVLELKGYNMPNMTLVDLPGLRATPQNSHQATHDLARSFLTKSNVLVLAVLPGTTPSLSSSLSLVLLDELEKQEMIIFALTRCDKISIPDLEDQLTDILLGGAGVTTHSSKYGFYATASPTQTKKTGGYFELMEREEADRFEIMVAETTDRIKNRVGLGKLQRAVVTIFVDYVRQVWAPRTHVLIGYVLRSEIQDSINSLGDDVLRFDAVMQQTWTVNILKEVFSSLCHELNSVTESSLRSWLPEMLKLGQCTERSIASRFKEEYGCGGLNSIMTEVDNRRTCIYTMESSLRGSDFPRRVLDSAFSSWNLQELKPHLGLQQKVIEWMSGIVSTCLIDFSEAARRQCLPVESVTLDAVVLATVVGPLMYECFRLCEGDMLDFLEEHVGGLAELLAQDSNRMERQRLYTKLEDIDRAIETLKVFLGESEEGPTIEWKNVLEVAGVGVGQSRVSNSMLKAQWRKARCWTDDIM